MVWSDRDLQETVERLAAPPESQLSWLDQLGTLPSLDELVLGFDDEFARLRGLPNANGGPRAIEALSALDQQLSRMSGPANQALWRPEALEGAEWRRVRARAASALTALAEGDSAS